MPVPPNMQQKGIIRQEVDVLLNKREVNQRVDEIIDTFRKKTDQQLAKSENDMAKLAATAEVRLTRQGRELSDGYQNYLGKINTLHDDFLKARTRAEAQELEETLQTYKDVVKKTKTMSKEEKKELRAVIKETEKASRIVRQQKLTRSKIFTDAIKNNLPDIAGMVSAIFGNNLPAAMLGGIAGDYLRQRREAKEQAEERRRDLWREDRDVEIGKSVELRRNRDDEIIRRWRRFRGPDEPPPLIRNNNPDTPPISPLTDNDDANYERLISIMAADIGDKVYQGVLDAFGYMSENGKGIKIRSDETKFKNANRDFEKASKEKRVEMLQKQLHEDTRSTARDSEVIAKASVAQAEFAKETSEFIEESTKNTEKTADIQTRQELFNSFRAIATFLDTNQGKIGGMIKGFGDKLAESDNKFVKKISKIFPPDMLSDFGKKVDKTLNTPIVKTVIGFASRKKDDLKLKKLDEIALILNKIFEKEDECDEAEQVNTENLFKNDIKVDVPDLESVTVGFEAQRQEESIGKEEERSDALKRHQDIIDRMDSILGALTYKTKENKSESILGTIMGDFGGVTKSLSSLFGFDIPEEDKKYPIVSLSKKTIKELADAIDDDSILGFMGKKKRKKKGLFRKVGKIGSKIKNLGLGAIGGVKGMLSPLAAAGTGLSGTSLLTTIGAGAAAGIAGYGIGTLINKGIDATVEKLTDGENKTFGGWLYNTTHPPKLEDSRHLQPSVTIDTPEIENRAIRNKTIEEISNTVNELRATNNVMTNNNVSNNSTVVGGSSTSISMPVFAGDSDRGTNLLTDIYAA